MKKINLVFILTIACALFVCASGVASATSYYVPDDYEKIQRAVNNASAGDTIIDYKHVAASDREITNLGMIIKPVGASSSSDWIVNTAETRSDEMIILNGNLTIQSGGNLTLDNFTLLLNCTFEGQYHIEVQNGGELHIFNSNITAANPDYRYCFWIRNGSMFEMKNSELHYCGYGTPGEVWDGLTGMWIGGDNAIIDGNLFSQNGIGIYLSAKFCTISNNTITNNTYHGIAQWSAHNNTIINNKIAFNGNCGIGGSVVSNSTIGDNTILNNNGPGIYLNESWNNTFSNNTCSNNSFGIGLGDANNNTLISNIFVNNGLFVWYSHDNIVEDNTVNGKPLVYLEGLSDAAVTDDAGQVILVNCNNITVQGKDLSYAGVGIELWETNDSTISNNIASNNNLAGIFILGSNNILKDNNASNNHFGIAVFSGLFNDIVSVNYRKRKGRRGKSETEYVLNPEALYPFIYETVYTRIQGEETIADLHKHLANPDTRKQLTRVTDFRQGLLTVFPPPQERTAKLMAYNKTNKFLDFLHYSNLHQKTLISIKKNAHEEYIRQEFIPSPLEFIGERLFSDFYLGLLPSDPPPLVLQQESIVLDLEQVVLGNYRVSEEAMDPESLLDMVFGYVEGVDNHRVKRFFGSNWAENMHPVVDSCSYFQTIEAEWKELEGGLRRRGGRARGGDLVRNSLKQVRSKRREHEGAKSEIKKALERHASGQNTLNGV